MKTLFFSGLTFVVSLLAISSFAATPPYAESFDSYAVGDTPVANFTEMATTAWTIVPSISGNGYQNDILASSSGPGIGAGTNSSAAISFPSLASSTFSMSTLFRIDALTVPPAAVNNTATIRLFARGADATPASTSSDRYEVSYYLDADSTHTAGTLYLNEINLFFGDGLLNTPSASSLPVTLGDIYQMTLSGVQSGGSVAITATLTDTTTSSSISVTKTDTSNLLTGSNFGYFDHVRVQDGGTTTLNADFDNFSMVPEPGTVLLMLFGWGIYFATLLNGRKR